MKRLRGLNAQLEVYMRNRGWMAKGTLTADIEWRHIRGKHYGVRYLPETVGRALRHLEEEAVIAVKDDGISVQYKWIPTHMRAGYIPSSRRLPHEKHILFKSGNL